MTLGPVSLQASLVTLKMPAPIRIPISAAYDSTVPRSRRRRGTIGEALEFLSVLLSGGGIRVSHSHPVSTGWPFLGKVFPNVFNGSRSEEHTSELQSRLHLVCRLLLEKKNE